MIGSDPTDDVPPAVLSLAGEVDTASVREFAAEAQRLLSADGLQRLVVDLGQVSFMDSSGLGLLVKIRTACLRDGIDLTLTRPPAGVIVLLQISGLDDHFHIDDAAI
jgi:anti-anti-sigma factor